MECVAVDSYVSVQLAWSGATVGRGSDWQPATGFPSSVNETLPVGVATPGVADEGETVAVSVTGWPGCGLADDDVIVTVVGSGATTWLRTAEALAPKTTSPR